MDIHIFQCGQLFLSITPTIVAPEDPRNPPKRRRADLNRGPPGICRQKLTAGGSTRLSYDGSFLSMRGSDKKVLIRFRKCRLTLHVSDPRGSEEMPSTYLPFVSKINYRPPEMSLKIQGVKK